MTPKNYTLAIVMAAFLSGCVSKHPSAEQAKPSGSPVDAAPVAVAPKPPSEPGSSKAAPASSHKKPKNTPAAGAAPHYPALQPGEYALMVESEPAGATVVVNGRPSGRTPCRVIVQANERGFLREQVSIRVRFVATDEAHFSQTVEDVLGTLDKVPAAIRFTSAGVSRVVR